VLWIAAYLKSWSTNKIVVLDRLYKWANGVGMWDNANPGSYQRDTSPTDMDPSTSTVEAGWEMLEGDRGTVTQAAALVRRCYPKIFCAWLIRPCSQYLWTETNPYSFLNDNGFLTWYKAMSGLSKYSSAVPTLAAAHEDLTDGIVCTCTIFILLFSLTNELLMAIDLRRSFRLFGGSKNSKALLC
jgi:hypothetical protein